MKSKKYKKIIIILPRLCFLASNASSVANKVFGKRMKILVLKLK